MAVALAGGWIAEHRGVGTILIPLTVVQGLGFLVAFLIHEGGRTRRVELEVDRPVNLATDLLTKDRALWAFVAAMILFHMANAPGGVYLGLFLNRDLHAPARLLAYAFVVTMLAWMLVVWPAGRLADRCGRRPLLIAGWAVMAIRLALIAVARSPRQVIAIQALDGLANGLFAVLAGAWVTDRLADPRRSGEAQVIVGSCLVLGSAAGPAVASLIVDLVGYRGLFAALAGLGALATGIVVVLVPETLGRYDSRLDERRVESRHRAPDVQVVP